MLYLPGVMHQRLLPIAFLLGALVVPATLRGHEIPARVAVVAIAKPDADALRIALRVPLEAMRDLEFPLLPDGGLDLVAVRPLLGEAARLWIADYLRVLVRGEALGAPRIGAVRIAPPSDRAFASWDATAAHFAAPPLDAVPGLRWQAAHLDVLLEYALDGAAAGTPAGALVIEPRLAHLGVRTLSVVRVVQPDGAERAFSYEGNPGPIALDPRWWQSAARFVAEGFRHILGGIDHLLFVFCLVLPVRRWRPLVAIVTAFTVAHSITLGAAALGLAPTALWFPPLVETLIALSIVYLTIENVLLPEERLAGRWRLAFAFGLIHGFGFSFALGEQLQFAGRNLVTALAAFNVGVELGQLLVLALALPLLGLVRRHAGPERGHLVTLVGSAVVAHTAWHWMTERFAALGEHPIPLAWPAFDAHLALAAMRVALVAAVALAAALGLQHIFRVRWRP